MQNVAIIGAGSLGGATAHALARSNLVRSITLIDETRRVAAGKALDIAQAAPVEGFATQLSGATEVSVAAGASIVILADRVTGGEALGDGIGVIEIAPALAQQEQIFVRLGAPVRHALRHRIRLRPDDVLPQEPAIGAKGEREHPRDAVEVLRLNPSLFDRSSLAPALRVIFDLRAMPTWVIAFGNSGPLRTPGTRIAVADIEP